MTDNRPNEHHTYLHALLVSILLMELMDNLAGTKYYKGLLKNRVNMLMPELKKIIEEDVTLLCRHVDNKQITSLMRDSDDFMKELALVHVHDYPIITGILSLFRENPEEVLEKLNINVFEKQTS